MCAAAAGVFAANNLTGAQTRCVSSLLLLHRSIVPFSASLLFLWGSRIEIRFPRFWENAAATRRPLFIQNPLRGHAHVQAPLPRHNRRDFAN